MDVEVKVEQIYPEQLEPKKSKSIFNLVLFMVVVGLFCLVNIYFVYQKEKKLEEEPIRILKISENVTKVSNYEIYLQDGKYVINNKILNPVIESEVYYLKNSNTVLFITDKSAYTFTDGELYTVEDVLTEVISVELSDNKIYVTKELLSKNYCELDPKDAYNYTLTYDLLSNEFKYDDKNIKINKTAEELQTNCLVDDSLNTPSDTL